MHPDEVACKELWMKAFGDDEQFADSFIMRYYSRRRMLTAEAEGRMAAMLHLLPFRTELGRTTYIYGVATDPAFRGRGLASQLMREAMRLIAERGDDAALLIPTPGKEWLREFYGRFGFAGDVPARFVSADRFDFGTATRPPTGRWSGGATPRFRSPNSSPPPGIHSLRNSPPRASFRPAPESVRHTAAPGAGDSPPRAAGTGSDNTSGSARHSSPPCRFPNCRRRKTDARQSRFTTIPQIKGNEKEMKGKWQIYQTKHD